MDAGSFDARTAGKIAFNTQVEMMIAAGVIERDAATWFDELSEGAQGHVERAAQWTFENRNQGADVRYRLQTKGQGVAWEALEAHERVAMRLFVAVVRCLG